VFRRLFLKPDKPVSYPFAWVSPRIHRMTLFVAPVGDFSATQLAPVSPRSYQEVSRKSEWAEPPTISLSLHRSGFLGAVRVGWRGAGEERAEVGRGCTTPSQRALQNHKRLFCFLQRIQLVRPCTTALQLASRIRPLIEYESSPGTLAIVAPRGST